MPEIGNPGLTKSLKAAATIVPYRIIAFDAQGRAAQATSATDAIIGVADLGAAKAGQVCDVRLGDLVPVEYGAAVQAGDPLTADAEGRAIKADPAAGTRVRAIGHAWVAGVAGDIGLAHLAPHQITG